MKKVIFALLIAAAVYAVSSYNVKIEISKNVAAAACEGGCN
jgi:hypothetical protein